MRAGGLRHRVSVQQPVETQNAAGEAVVAWADVVPGTWAGIEPLKGREFFAAKQVNAEIDVRIRMRYRTGITAKMRVLDLCHGSNEYYIAAVINPEERGRELQLMCTRSME